MVTNDEEYGSAAKVNGEDDFNHPLMSIVI